MDQHPIPQDVTGFQFKLIGAMTVKQFGYVASGVIMAVVLYYLPLHSALGVLLKVLLVPLFGAGGVVIAFVPVDGRPIDVMTTNFVKALFSPNQYVYHRQGRSLSFESVSVIKIKPQTKTSTQEPLTHTQASQKQLDQKEARLRELLMSTHGHGESAIDKRETAFLNSLTISSTPTSTPQAGPAMPTGMPMKKVAPEPQFLGSQKTVQMAPLMKPQQQLQPLTPKPAENSTSREELSKKESELTQALSQAKQEELTSKTPENRAIAEQKMALLSKQVQEIHLQKQRLEQELYALQKQLNSQKASILSTPTQKPVAAAQTVQDPQHVRALSQGVTQKAGLPHVSDSPNVIVGIVKDPRGNVLPNILVEVKDKDDNPVRAFKTNQLGQFASATPLSTGAYTMILEDPKRHQQFDAIKITANNQIMPPIEIISHDAREELRKQLFAN